MLCSRSSALVVIGFCAIGLFLVGCDTAVPLFENPDDHPLYYSLYGQVSHPEGGAIRVEFLRDSVVRGAPETPPGVVTFTRLATGVMDTLSVHSRQVEQASVYNYRTPSGLRLGEAYRVKVEGKGGRESTARFALPEHKPEVEVLDTLRYCNPSNFEDRHVLPVRIRVRGVRNVAYVALRYRPLKWSTLTDPFPWTRATRRVDSTTHRVFTVPNFDLLELGPPVVVDSATVTVAAAGPAWPGGEFNVRSLSELSAPTRDSNVRQGVGLVVGTSRKEVSVPVKVPEILPNGDLDVPPCPDSTREF